MWTRTTLTTHTQEPWAEAEIKEYVSKTYGTKFDLFAKVNVNGGDAHPLYQWLKSRLPGTLGECAPAHTRTCSLEHFTLFYSY